MNDPARLMREKKEEVENAERDCWDGEGVDRGQLLGLVYQECMPGLRGRFWMSGQVLGDSCLRDIDSEFEQFALNSRSSRGGIIFTHGADELTNMFRNPRFPRLTALAFPGLKQAEFLAMPGEDGFRFDNDESRAPLEPEAQKPNPASLEMQKWRPVIAQFLMIFWFVLCSFLGFTARI